MPEVFLAESQSNFCFTQQIRIISETHLMGNRSQYLSVIALVYVMIVFVASCSHYFYLYARVLNRSFST